MCVLRIVKVLLEQVVSSTIERCVDPQLMEQSVCLYNTNTKLHTLTKGPWSCVFSPLTGGGGHM